jgi:hypothetical protein
MAEVVIPLGEDVLSISGVQIVYRVDTASVSLRETRRISGRWW